MANSLKDIPGPPGWPFIGNLLDLRNGDYPLQALERLAAQYGEVFTIMNRGSRRVFISSVRLLDELCDDSRFQKQGVGPNRLLPRSGPPGLFSASNESDEWAIAHRVLMPAFGPLAIEGLFDGMHDIAKQLTLKWARAGPDEPVSVTDDFTRLTLDTIALCAMGYRFNSFYHESQHPFVKAMTATLAESSARVTRPTFVTKLMDADKQVKIDQEFQRSVGREIVSKRRQQTEESGSQHHDLLDHMVNGKDPNTGKTMDDDLINSNMNTFLVAGHETTSSLLSFATYNLLKHPAAYLTAQREVDEVAGFSPLKLDHIKKLPYLNAVLRETLRLFPTAPAFTRLTKPGTSEDVVPFGGYALPCGTPVTVLLGATHRDQTVYGSDANEFKPERMLEEHFKKLPSNAWKPFGTGVRACIGRAFAWQEALLALAMLLQRFDLRFDNPAYDLPLQVNLTMKPKDLYIRTRLRHNIDAIELEKQLSGVANATVITNSDDGLSRVNGGSTERKEVTILFGSNTGTCEALAQRLATDAKKLGYKQKVDSLDSAAHGLPTNQPVVIFTSSYEGQPPDNARRFTEALSSWSEDKCKGVQYAVFGCGHHDWTSTFHRIPKLVDDDLAAAGAERLAPLGLSDVGQSTIFDDFDSWKDDKLASIFGGNGIEVTAAPPHELHVELSSSEVATRPYRNTYEAEVVENSRLTVSGEPEKRHCAFRLPERLSYTTGDYLAVSPKNTEIVDQIVSHFGLQDKTAMRTRGGPSSVPSEQWLSVKDVLAGCVELQQPIALKDMRYLCELTTSPGEKAEMEQLIRLRADSRAPDKRMTVFELLDKYPSIKLDFTDFIALLPPLRPRLYSISSSPLHDHSTATVTYSVHSENGTAPGQVYCHRGVCTSYMAALKLRSKVQVSIKPGKPTFRLPTLEDQRKRPLIMIGAGAGIAPFRAFVEERAEHFKVQKDLKLAPAVLYMGCRSSTADRLYADELDQWTGLGAVEVKYAFSQQPEKNEGCRYIQERLVQDRRTVETMWKQNAKIFVCGSSKLAQEIKRALRDIVKRALEERNEPTDDEMIRKQLELVTEDRFVTDVFG